MSDAFVKRPAGPVDTRGEVEVPMLDLGPEIEALRAELEAAVAAVLDSRRFVMGPALERFEAACAEYLGCERTLGVHSGTDALVLGLRALGIGPGDEVITTPFTFFATVEAILTVGASPVFVDIEPATFNLDVARLEAAVTERTRAVLPVHLFGHACDMDPLLEITRRLGLAVLEDVAQAFGGAYRSRRDGALAKLGTLGDLGAFSFFPSKNLGGFGDGGLVACDRPEVADAIAMLRAHGARRKHVHEALGTNSRLDTLQAALLAVKLPYLDEQNRARRQVARRYDEFLSEVEGVVPPPVAEYAHHVYHQYTVRLPGRRRDAVREALRAQGVSSMVHYPVPCHRAPLVAGGHPEMPESDRAAAEVLSLPIWPSMDAGTQGRVVEALRRSLEAMAQRPG